MSSRSTLSETISQSMALFEAQYGAYQETIGLARVGEAGRRSRHS